MGLFRKNRRPEPFDGTVTVNGVRHPVRDDFATFSQDALAGRIALLATTIADASWTTHAARLHEVLAAAFGEDAPPTRAAVGSSLCCLHCLREYPFHVLMLRDTVRDGGGAGAIAGSRAGAEDAGRVMTMTACVSCGGADGAWIYDPARDPG
jgi:hypothetical protein